MHIISVKGHGLVVRVAEITFRISDRAMHVFMSEKNHLSSMWLQEKAVTNFWLFRYNFLSLFPPPASSNSPAKHRNPIQVGDLYAD